MKWGYINKGALKHSMVFNDKSFVGVSPLYRAELFEGELPRKEQHLKEISKFFYRNEEKGRNFYNYVSEMDKSGKGIEVEKIKRYIHELL